MNRKDEKYLRRVAKALAKSTKNFKRMSMSGQEETIDQLKTTLKMEYGIEIKIEKVKSHDNSIRVVSEVWEG